MGRGVLIHKDRSVSLGPPGRASRTGFDQGSDLGLRVRGHLSLAVKHEHALGRLHLVFAPGERNVLSLFNRHHFKTERFTICPPPSPALCGLLVIGHPVSTLLEALLDASLKRDFEVYGLNSKPPAHC